MPLRDRDLAGLRAVVNHPEQHEELRPRAVALAHRVRMVGRVLAQAIVETCERVEAQEGVFLRQHLPLLRVEQEHESQHDREQSAIDLVGIVLQGLAKQLTARGVVGGLEAPEQLVERVENLFGELLADLVLVAPAVCEQCREALRRQEGEQALFAQQETERGQNRPAGRLDHLGLG